MVMVNEEQCLINFNIRDSKETISQFKSPTLSKEVKSGDYIMKLSEHTVEVLKNFATINQNLVIKEGSTLTTMSIHEKYCCKSRCRRII